MRRSKKYKRKQRRRQKAFGAIFVVVGVILIAIAVLQWIGAMPEATLTVATLPDQLGGHTICITSATLALAGVTMNFVGSALLLSLCGCCVLCIYSGIDQSELVPIRAYRDKVLRASWYGRVFVWLYYNCVSPLFILFIWMIPRRSWKRRLGLWLIPRLSRWCKRRTNNAKRGVKE